MQELFRCTYAQIDLNFAKENIHKIARMQSTLFMLSSQKMINMFPLIGEK